MNVLLISPEYPDTFFSFNHALPFISKRAVEPPLGLITVSAVLPENWNKKLVDLNVSSLDYTDLDWADYIFISAMIIQKESVDKIIKIIKECLKYRKTIVAGGPLFLHEYEKYPEIDTFILNEAEITLPQFLRDLDSGNSINKIYQTKNYSDISHSPCPDFHLLAQKKYASMNLQFSRGCPFQCDFCEIPILLGNKVRIKDWIQIIKELDTLYNLNWRGTVSIVDDNFIGNKNKIKYEILPAIIEWMKNHKYPFIFNIQASANIADDEELLLLMTQAGIQSIFIGIETLSEKSLQKSNKIQNTNRDMLKAIKIIQKAGLQVSGGFIVGFDNDTPAVFQQQIDFIQESGIVWAMVGMLNAPKNTPLYKRLKKEKRLTNDLSGNNTDYTINFIPEMDLNELVKGFQSIFINIYSVKPYYKRVRQLLLNYCPANKWQQKTDRYYFMAFLKSIIILGITKKGQIEYWKFLFWTILNRPRLFLHAIMFSICGYHFRKVYGIN